MCKQQRIAHKYYNVLLVANSFYGNNASLTKQQHMALYACCLLNAWQRTLPGINFVAMQLVPMLQLPSVGNWQPVVNVLQHN